MKKSALFAFLSLAIIAIAYAIFRIDWCDATSSLHYAAAWLGLNGDPSRYFPLWGRFVRACGANLSALSLLSAGATLVNAALLSFVFYRMFARAAKGAKEMDKGDDRLRFIVPVGTALGALAFAFSPFVFVAATRVSPFAFVILPEVVILALLVKFLKGHRYGKSFGWRFMHGGWAILPGIVIFVYSLLEIYAARRVVLDIVLLPIVWYFAVGFMPGAVVSWCIRRHWLNTRLAAVGGFVVWAGLTIMAYAVNPGIYAHGQAADRIVRMIVTNAEGKQAIAVDGVLADMLGFVGGEIRAIDIARNRDPAYGRALAKWAKELGLDEDCVFAAELGPMAFIDEWTKRDRAGLERTIAGMTNYFPTRLDWEMAADEAKNLDDVHEIDRHMRHVIGVAGNFLGCKALEKGEDREAWGIFWRIANEVEPSNYGAVLNLTLMIERGYLVGERAVEIVKRWRDGLEGKFKKRSEMVRAVRSSGRIYVDPETVAAFERERREAAAKAELSPEAKAFVETVSAAPKDPESGLKAREAIVKALREGKMSVRAIGSELVTIDIALGDMEEAEKDAIEVLRVDRHNVVANTLVGSLNAQRGDYEAAERYFKRAIATGKPSLATKNDYAMTLMRLGQYGLAEDFAREVVVAMPEEWNLHETLAAILVRAGKIAEAEKEIAKIDELLKKARIAPSRVVSLEIDRALVYKAKGEKEKLAKVKRSLEYRENLTDVQRAEIEAL